MKFFDRLRRRRQRLSDDEALGLAEAWASSPEGFHLAVRQADAMCAPEDRPDLERVKNLAAKLARARFPRAFDSKPRWIDTPNAKERQR
jgi:hypothetical protein